jgi:HK97 family phage portal protein
MSDTTNNGFFFRLAQLFAPSETKQLENVQNKPLVLDHGATYAQPMGVRPTYNPEEAMSAYAGHGYTYAAVSRAAQDLAALPLRLLKGKNRVLVEEHPVIDLLDKPSSTVDGFLFREQLCTDLILTGNCYILLLGQTDKPTSIVRLHPEDIQPSTDNTGIIGYIYRSGGQTVAYPVERIVHGRLASWKNGPSELIGTGAIEPLARELTADINSQNLVSNASAQARPDLLISPKDPSDIWGPEMRRDIASQYRKLSAQGGAMVLSGLAQIEPLSLSPRDMEYVEARKMARESISAVTGVPPTVLGLPSANYALSRQQARNYWSVQTKRGKRLAMLFSSIAQRWSEDLEFEHDYSGVEALQESRTEQLERVQMHIMNGISPRAAYKYEGLDYPDDIEGSESNASDVPAEDARQFLARLYTTEQTEKAVGDEDPTNFPADGDNEKVGLRNSNFRTFDYEYAQDLKENWPAIWKAGGNIEGNNQYRRLSPVVRRESRQPETETEEMAIRKREAWGARHFGDGAQFDSDDPPSPNISSIAGIIAQIKWFVVGELGMTRMKEIIEQVKAKQTRERARTDLWRLWLREYNEPAFKSIARAARAYLRGALARYEGRIEQYVKPSLTKSVIDYRELLAEAEEVEIASFIIGSKWRRWYTTTGNAQLKDIIKLSTQDYDGQTINPEDTEQFVDLFARQIVRTQSNAITSLVDKGLQDGQAIPAIANSLSDVFAFSTQRALMIARTESTRAANLGTQRAYSEAMAIGIQVRKQWLSARDESVRNSHAALDGQTVGVNENFVSESGAEALSPATFGDASEDVNCRCTMIPIVD